jgi:8-oxo-dGTP pyrophosphatase MutT (NUDIX family)
MDRESNVRSVVLAVVSDEAERVLLVRSARRPQRWELPGGALQPRESPMAAVRREILEETGVVLDCLRLVGLYYGYEDYLLRITFAGKAIAAAEVGRRRGPDRDEILEVGWFEPYSLPRPIPSLAQRMIVNALQSGPAVLATVASDRALIL